MATSVSTFSWLHHHGEGRNVLHRSYLWSAGTPVPKKKKKGCQMTRIPHSVSLILSPFISGMTTEGWIEQKNRADISSYLLKSSHWREQKASVIWRTTYGNTLECDLLLEKMEACSFLVFFFSQLHDRICEVWRNFSRCSLGKTHPLCNDIASAKELVVFLCNLRPRDYDLYVLYISVASNINQGSTERWKKSWLLLVGYTFKTCRCYVKERGGKAWLKWWLRSWPSFL